MLRDQTYLRAGIFKHFVPARQATSLADLMPWNKKIGLCSLNKYNLSCAGDMTQRWLRGP
jgi:hypothetical protein